MSIQSSAIRLNLGCAFLCFAAGAHAQDVAQTPAPAAEVAIELDDVIVTATRTGATALQKTPLAITAVTSEGLKQSGSNDVRDLTRVVPSLTVSENTGWSQVYIRGVGSSNIFIGSEASVATQVDGVYLGRPSSVFSDFLDVDRVEVLRGPQGTLYGRNAAGGIINIITSAPSNVPRAEGLASYGNYSDVRVAGSVSGAIVPDVFQASVAGLYARHDSYIRNIFPGGHGLNNREDLSFRGKLRIMPSSSTQVILAADYSLQKGRPWGAGKIITAPTFMAQVIPDAHTVSNEQESYGRNRQYGFSGTLDSDLGGGFELTSITAYRNSDYAIGADSDGTELPLRFSQIAERQNQFSQETQLNYTNDRVKAIFGLFYFREKAVANFDIGILPARLSSRVLPAATTNAYAGFGQIEYKLSPIVALTAGLRYSSEEKVFNQFTGLAPLNALPSIGVVRFTDRNKFNSTTPKFGISIIPSDSVLIYASATRGFKSGGFNVSAAAAGRGFAPETLWSYEIGSKVILLENKLRLAGSVFYYDYNNLQVQTFISAGVVDISNAATARIKGVELEGTFAISPGLHIGGNIAYLDAKYTEYLAAINGSVVDVSGNFLNQAPRWKASGFINYDTDLSNGGSLFFNGQVSYQDNVYFRSDNIDVLSQKGYVILSARAGYRPPNDHWEVAAYIKNATDQAYINAADTLSPAGPGGRTGDPRTYGIQISFRY